MQKLKKLFTQNPILILELNKFIPKGSRLQLLEPENADNFLQKIKDKDEATFKEVMKTILSLKNGEINVEKIVTKFEELLGKYPELLEEAYLFADYRKIGSANYKKLVANAHKSSHNNQCKNDTKKHNTTEHNNEYKTERNISNNYRDTIPMSSKIQASPEYVFFSSLKELFTPEVYQVVIKLFHLFNEGVLSQNDLIEISQPYFSRQIDLFEYMKNMTHSKKMNRRQYAIFNRPTCEIDFSKSLKMTGYYELPKDYPYRISSARKPWEAAILNDRLITIPTGSEEDKNPMKKNHYEENLFKFEDQRYEIDLQIDVFNYVISELDKLYKKICDNNINTLTMEELEKEVSSSTIRFIIHFYEDCGQQVINKLLVHPKIVLNDIIIPRFKKKIEGKYQKKNEVDKTIKTTFDRFYYKSFDYRSFKFKNFDKKNNNAKAFIKEIVSRKKDKLISTNSNILKGGTNDFEFFTSLHLKSHKDNVLNKIKDSNDSILMKDVDLESIVKKLPDIKIIFEDTDILKLTFAFIYYQMFHTNHVDIDKLIEYFNPFILSIFGMNMNNFINTFKTNREEYDDKNLSFNEIIEQIKNNTINVNDYHNYYKMDKLAQLIEYTNNDDNSHINNSENSDKKNSESDCLLSSLLSQDHGETFREIIIYNPDKKDNDTSFLFYPPKSDNNIVFYSNENCFIFIRYVFCIYERLNKLKEYTATALIDVKKEKKKEDKKSIYPNTNDYPISPYVFENFFIIYNALLHKKIENANIYEELCRDILGNESYFIFNMDKLVGSLIKTMITIINDNLSKEVLNLFKFEICRKNEPNEKLYFSNYLQLLDNNTSNNFRILINPKSLIMAIYLMDLPAEQNKKDYYDQFKEFVNKTLQESYSSLYEGNFTDEDPFNIFLIRNKKILEKKKKDKPAFCSNNLIFRFDYANKKLQYLSSGCDIILNNKKDYPYLDKVKTIVKKNIIFTNWINQRIHSFK